MDCRARGYPSVSDLHEQDELAAGASPNPLLALAGASSAGTVRRIRGGSREPAEHRDYSQLSSIGYVESCSNPSLVISTCSSSLTASRPPAGAASASTHITMPSLKTPS